MILVKPSFEILNVNASLELIERAGRTCYKSESKVGEFHTAEFIQSIIKRGHESVIEHSSVMVKIICDRGVTHEIVRHRLASYSQESTRYCNYGGGVTFVIPPWTSFLEGEYHHIFCAKWDIPFNAEQVWFSSMLDHEDQYIALLDLGWTPQQARSVLPNSLKTEIVMTANLREWRHFFKLRCTPAAHPQMREIAIPMLESFRHLVPIIFDDIPGPGIVNVRSLWK